MKNSFTLYTLAWTVIFTLIRFVLSRFGLMLRQWAILAGIGIILLGIIASVIQMILRLENRKTRMIISLIFVGSTMALAFSQYPAAVFAYMPEHLAERDGKKYVAYVNSFQDTYAFLHEYVNDIVCGQVIRIEEYYGEGAFDPFTDGSHPVQKAAFYDESGQFTEVKEY